MTSVDKFYKDIDELHKAVEKFCYSVYLNDLLKSWQAFGEELGRLLLP